MSLISIVVFIVILGLVLYLVQTVIPLPQWAKVVINVLCALVVIVWLLQLLGYSGHVFNIRIH